MAASDRLADLAKRAKVAEDRVAAAKTQARADVEAQAGKVREAAQRKAEEFRAQRATAAAGGQQRWDEVRSSWSEHVARVRQDMAGKKAQMQSENAQIRADVAEDDAVAAVDFAGAALEEAEYAVLNATLARRDADVAAT